MRLRAHLEWALTMSTQSLALLAMPVRHVEQMTGSRIPLLLFTFVFTFLQGVEFRNFNIYRIYDCIGRAAATIKSAKVNAASWRHTECHKPMHMYVYR